MNMYYYNSGTLLFKTKIPCHQPHPSQNVGIAAAILEYIHRRHSVNPVSNYGTHVQKQTLND